MSIHDITEKDAAYGYFMDPRNPALDLVCEMVEPANPGHSRNTWRKRLWILGEEQFRHQLYYFWSDMRHAGSLRSPAAAFTARLNKIIGFSAGGAS